MHFCFFFLMEIEITNFIYERNNSQHIICYHMGKHMEKFIYCNRCRLLMKNLETFYIFTVAIGDKTIKNAMHQIHSCIEAYLNIPTFPLTIYFI